MQDGSYMTSGRFAARKSAWLPFAGFAKTETLPSSRRSSAETLSNSARERSSPTALSALATRDIRSLDGLRAFSILLVMAAHSSWYLPGWVTQNSFFRSVIGGGTHGVAVFFVISGYLITTLLLREFDKRGTVSLKRFYFRRTMRIFPPFYCFLGVMGLLWTFRIIPEDWRSFCASITYTWAYFPWSHGYFIFHTWSLSIEEQFYLLWPLLFAVLHRRLKLLIRASLLFIVLMPAIRVLFYFVLPGLRGHEFYMVQGWLDTMMIGCVLALSKRQGKWDRWQAKYVNGWTAGVMAMMALYAVPMVTEQLPKRMAGLFVLAIGPTITACCLGGLLLYVTTTNNVFTLKMLNNAVIRHIGVLSYSLYLWQQLFLSQKLALLPYGYLAALAAAECSFWLVERPALRLRARLEATWRPRSANV
jgi:peptidoglycan/LPS O-acetylase OafA/YrhL